MNQRCYRIVFNRARGQLMAVSEAVRSSRCGAALGGSSRRRSSAGARIPPVLALSVLAMALSQAHAQVRASAVVPKSQQPVVLLTANKLPLVNIQTPSAAGVSRNVYSQFDVDAKGVVLNNARSNALTQLAGWVPANPLVAAGPARVIVNEIQSTNPSLLGGFIEVAGSRAEVIFANPTGISCAGCGFINSARTTLTTGTPVFAPSGEVISYRLGGGSISISNNGDYGLYDSDVQGVPGSDETLLLSRSILVSGSVWAKNLTAIAGASELTPAGTVSGPGTPPTQPAPLFGVDVASVGGMYAGAISLVATEAGVGVRNAGSIVASSGRVAITAQGPISNPGSVFAATNLNVTAVGDLSNSGSMFGQGDSRIAVTGPMENSGFIGAGKDTIIALSGTAASFSAASTSVIASGVQIQEGTISGTGQLSLAAERGVSVGGRLLAAGRLFVEGVSTSLVQADVVADVMHLRSTVGDLSLQGSSVAVKGRAELETPQTLRTDSAILAADAFTVTALSLSNINGSISSLGSGPLQLHVSGSLNNTGGAVSAVGDALSIRATDIRADQGTFFHGGSGLFSMMASSITAPQALIGTNGSLEASLGEAHIPAVEISARSLNLSADSLDVSSGKLLQSGAGAARLVVQGELKTTSGLISSEGSLSVSAGSVSNRGGAIQTTGPYDLRLNVAGIVDNADGGLVQSGGVLDLSAESLLNTNGSRFVASGSMTIQLRSGLDNSSSELAAAGSLTLSARSLSNASGRIASILDGVSLQVTEGAALDSGSVTAAREVSILAGAVTSSGSVYAGSGLRAKVSGEFVNAGILASGSDTAIESGSFKGTAASLVAAGMNQDGSFRSSGEVSLSAVRAFASQGRFSAPGRLAIRATDLDMSSAVLTASSIDLAAGSGDLTLAEASVSGRESVSLSANDAINTNDALVEGGHLSVNARSVSNIGGRLVHLGPAGLRLAIAGDFDNTGGTLLVGGSDLELTAGRVLNSQGTIHLAGEGALTLDALSLRNDAGQLVSNGRILATVGEIANDGGTIAGVLLSLSSEAAFSNRGGRILHSGTGIFSLSAGTEVDNTAGEVQANGSVVVRAASWRNESGLVNVAGSAGVEMSISGQISNDSGIIAAGGAIDLTSAAVGNSRGQMVSASALKIASGVVDNTVGILASTGSLEISAAELNNNDGLAQAGTVGRITLTGRLQNAAGQIFAAGSLTLGATDILTSGSVYSVGDLSVTARGRIDNSGAVGSQRNTQVIADQLSGSGNSLFVAGLRPDLSLGAVGDLQLSGEQSVSVSGQAIAPGSLSIGGSSVDLSFATLTARDILLAAQRSSVLARSATIQATETLSVQADSDPSQGLDISRGSVSAARMLLQTASLINDDGDLRLTGQQGPSFELSGSLRNVQGQIVFNAADASVRAGSIENAGGVIAHAGSGTFSVTATSLTMEAGKLASNGRLEVSGGSFNVGGGLVLAQAIRFNASSLANASGQIIQLGDAPSDWSLTSALTNDAGLIASNGSLSIAAGQVFNRGGTVLTSGSASLTLTSQGEVDNGMRGALNAGGGLVVNADRILNAGGAIQTSEAAVLTSSGAFDNTMGLVVARKGVDAAAASIDNTSGTISALTREVNLIATSGSVQNASGRIEAQEAVSIRSVGLSNAGGSVVGRAVSLGTGSAAFDNSGGNVAALQDLTITSGALTNAQGLLQAGAALQIDTSGQRLTNTNSGAVGGIVSGQSARLLVGELLNQSGAILSGGPIYIAGSALTNTDGGSIGSRNALTIVGSSFTNDSGSVQALSSLDLNVGSGRVSNVAGLLRSDGALSIVAGVIDNGNTGPADRGLQGMSIALAAGQVINRSGAIVATDELSIVSSGAIDNANGVLSAGTDLLLADSSAGAKQLTITNTNGLIIAGRQLVIDARSESGDGELTSLGTLNLTLAADHVISGTVQSAGDLSMAIAGVLENRGKVTSANALSVRAVSIDNVAAGEMRGNIVDLTADGTLTNRGLIDGVQTRLTAGLLSNLGTGRIYGDLVSIAADQIDNGAEGGFAPVIAARDRLDLGVGFLNNSDLALIFSLGDIRIGGTLDQNRRATGQANAIINSGATIEALGDVVISSLKLSNLNPNFATQEAVVSTEVRVDLQPTGSPNIYPSPPAYQDNGAVDGLAEAHTPEGDTDDFLRYDYTRTVTETQVVTTNPGQILAGGGIRFNIDELLNDKSKIIAGGAIEGSVGSLVNTDVQGVRQTSDVGTVSHYYRRKKKGADAQGLDVSSYTPSPTAEAISLYPTLYASNTAPSGSGLIVPGLSGTDVSKTIAGASSAVVGTAPGTVIEVRSTVSGGAVAAQDSVVAAGPVSSSIDAQAVSTGADLAGASAVTGVAADEAGSSGAAATGATVALTGELAVDPVRAVATPFVVRTLSLDLKIPNNGLFRPATKPDTGFLVVTDPQFIDYGKWLSSDYMLQLLGVDPATIQLRIGDGFYEQKLVRDQIAQLTGRRLLPGYANDQDQFKALMAAGAAFAKQVNIRPGIALSPELMAKLTTDIVWLEKTNVTMPDGTVVKDVYVPRVYTRVREGTVTGAGGLVAGANIDISIDRGLLNSAATFAADRINLSTRELANSGRISGLDMVSLQVKDRLVNEGGTIDAGRLLALTGGTVDVASLVRQTTSAQGSRTGIFKPASLYVSEPGGALVIDASNINFRGADVTAAGQIQLKSQDGVNLGTVMTDQRNMIRFNGTNWIGQSSQRTVGTNVESGGPLTINAKGNVDITGSSVATKGLGSLQVVSGGSINVSAGLDKTTYDSQFTKKESSFLSKSKTTTIVQREVTTPLMSTVSGHTTVLAAQKNVTIGGGFVVSTAGTEINAGGDIVVEAAKGSFFDRSVVLQKRSGMLAGGPTGFTVGVMKQNSSADSKGSTLTSSQVGSVLGDVVLASQGRTRVMASNILAPKGTVSISASGIELLSGESTTERIYRTELSQRGLTVGSPQAGVLDSVRSIGSLAAAVGKTSDDPRMLALGSFAIAQKGVDLVKDVGQAISNAEAGKTSLAISLTYGSSKSSSVQSLATTRAVATDVRGLNVLLDARSGSLDIVGSKVKAVQDALLKGGVIDVRAAEETRDVLQSQKSSSRSFGVTASTDGSIGVTLGGSIGRGKGSQHEVRWSQSEVEAGETLTLVAEGDANVEGSTLKGNRVVARVGGELVMRSLQDSSTASSSNRTAGGSLTIGPGSLSATVNFARSSFQGDHQSVTQYAGIMAGNGGFEVEAGKTKLVGAVVASTAEAQAAGRNRIVGAVTTQDIVNRSSFSGVAMSFGVSSGGGGRAASAQQKGNNSSVTVACTSLSVSQCVTGALKLDVLRDNPKSAEVIGRLEAENLITQEFGATATKAFADFAESNARRLMTQAAGLPAGSAEAEALRKEAAFWGEGGGARIVGEALIGGLAGGPQGALGAASAAWAADKLNELQGEMAERLEKFGVGTSAAKAMSRLLVSVAATSGAGAVGGVAAAAGFSTVDQNNRALHVDELAALKRLAKGDVDKEQRLWAAACHLVKCYLQFASDDPNYRIAKETSEVGATLQIELAELAREREVAGLFEYTRWNRTTDWLLSHPTEVGIAGIGLNSLGAAAGVGLCSTGLGCLAGGPLILVSGAGYVESVQTVGTGKFAPNYIAEGLMAAGMPEKYAVLAPVVLSAPAIGKSLLSLGTAASLSKGATALDDLPRLPKPAFVESSRGLAPGGNAPTETSILLNGPIEITERGMAHVVNRHTVNGIAKYANKSKFNQGEDLEALINSGTQQRVVLQPNGNYVRTWDVGRAIGVDRSTGSQTSVMTVVTRQNGELVTAHPGPPLP